MSRPQDPPPDEEKGPAGATTSAIVRTQRALQILRLLQAGQVWTATELAAQFGCSTRTIFRDLQLLRECGIPIDSPRGERGFRLSHDFFWQPVRPTLDEMIALVMGARMAGDAMPREMAKDLESAVAKIVGSERPAVRQRLTEINLRIDSPHLTASPALPDVAFLQQLLEHIAAQRCVRLVESLDPQSLREREMLPLRLTFNGQQWVLFCSPYEGGPEEAIPLARIARVLGGEISRESSSSSSTLAMERPAAPLTALAGEENGTS